MEWPQFLVQGGALTALVYFAWRFFNFFEAKFNGSFDALRTALEHNTRNLKTIQQLSNIIQERTTLHHNELIATIKESADEKRALAKALAHNNVLLEDVEYALDKFELKGRPSAHRK